MESSLEPTQVADVGIYNCAGCVTFMGRCMSDYSVGFQKDLELRVPTAWI